MNCVFLIWNKSAFDCINVPLSKSSDMMPLIKIEFFSLILESDKAKIVPPKDVALLLINLQLSILRA